MVNEIFIREETDPYYVDGVLETGNTTENIISKIRMFLETVPGDVLGDDNFGIDIEYLVDSSNISCIVKSIAVSFVIFSSLLLSTFPNICSSTFPFQSFPIFIITRELLFYKLMPI